MKAQHNVLTPLSLLSLSSMDHHSNLHQSYSFLHQHLIGLVLSLGTFKVSPSNQILKKVQFFPKLSFFSNIYPSLKRAKFGPMNDLMHFWFEQCHTFINTTNTSFIEKFKMKMVTWKGVRFNKKKVSVKLGSTALATARGNSMPKRLSVLFKILVKNSSKLGPWPEKEIYHN